MSSIFFQSVSAVSGLTEPQVLWVDGRFVAATDVRLAPWSSLLTHGWSVFETMLGLSGRVFNAERHWARLEAGLSTLGLESTGTTPWTHIAGEILSGAGLGASGVRARVRITVTDNGPAGALSILAWAVPLGEWPSSAALTSVPWRKEKGSWLSGVKSGNYALSIRALREAHKLGADEAVLLNSEGELCEAAMANIFLVCRGALYTPSLETGCLPGTMRAWVLEAAQKLGIPVHQGLSTQFNQSLLNAEEVFLTSATRGIQMVHRLDNLHWPSESGPITRKLQETLAAEMAEFERALS